MPEATFRPSGNYPMPKTQPKFRHNLLQAAETRDGRSEHHDCAVVAVMHATGVSYREAHNILATHCMRRPGRCVKGTPWNAYLRSRFQEVCLSNFRSTTLNAVIPALDPDSTYIVRVRRHCFAVVN